MIWRQPVIPNRSTAARKKGIPRWDTPNLLRPWLESTQDRSYASLIFIAATKWSQCNESSITHKHGGYESETCIQVGTWTSFKALGRVASRISNDQDRKAISFSA
eukprot:524991-Amphidinium_carterae.1